MAGACALGKYGVFVVLRVFERGVFGLNPFAKQHFLVANQAVMLDSSTSHIEGQREAQVERWYWVPGITCNPFVWNGGKFFLSAPFGVRNLASAVPAWRR